MMNTYDALAKYYDSIAGDQKQSAKFIHKLIKKYHPQANTLLDVACGTGSHLSYLSKYYDSAGLDISAEMLSIAKIKLKDVPMFQNDMTSFDFAESYDVIICINDSINHIQKKSSWNKFFKNVRKHLNDNGVFIFSMNTPYNLNRLSDTPPIVHQFDSNYLITKVNRTKNNTFEWDLRIFEYQKNNDYKLHQSLLYQISLDTDKIRKLLSNIFQKVYIFDSDQKKVTSKSQRLYCVGIK